MNQPDRLEVATFGAGCFWCVEAIFQGLDGVASVVSGYAGGKVDNPTYEEVCTGTTGHAEVCQITYNPARIAYQELLKVFFEAHDPTTINRQGPDVGTQYRSVIFYHDDRQREAAEQSKRELNASGKLPNPVVTEITPFTNFFPAEGYHQNYYRLNANTPYSAAVIRPKVAKFKSFLKNKP